MNSLISTTIKFPAWTGANGVIIERNALIPLSFDILTQRLTTASGQSTTALSNGFEQALKGVPSLHLTAWLGIDVDVKAISSADCTKLGLVVLVILMSQN